MTKWSRAANDRSCGSCGDHIAIGRPLLLISSERIKRELVRCEKCAGPAPPDLPALIERRPIPETVLRPFTRDLPLELERDPGQEG